MAIIFETKNFIVESHENPEVDRFDGGHMKITPKVTVKDRTYLSPVIAIELMRLTIICGIALKESMAMIGVNIGRINYQDNGNWKPELHIHIYGRSLDAKYQKYGDTIIPGHKDEYQALTQEDVIRIREVFERLLQEEKFSDKEWGL